MHLVHFGGGMSGHIKLAGSRFFDWITAGKRVYTDLSWAIGFAPRWLADEVSRRGIGQDRILFASDEPWGDHAGEYARMRAAASGRELADLVFRENFDRCTDDQRPFGDRTHTHKEMKHDRTDRDRSPEHQRDPAPVAARGIEHLRRTKVFPDYQAEPGSPTSPWSTASRTSPR